MKIEIKLSMKEFNSIVKSLSLDKNSTFIFHLTYFSDYKIALQHCIKDVLHDCGFDLPDNHINIEIAGE
ncbi:MULTISPECIES: hypothetical protein [Photorhabdus]|uniref:hypothetical protein n=1 Tax=Photorhabdus TaxID=29487 RepID=UPI000DCBA5AE|nr:MULTISPECIES: hypothetical protein [Photorhabdus]MCT8345133.1 hypothetical protein [Photorhabdus kleinii]RAW91425.1 hypothetical protein CKY05_24075 [Photorhabdus sp. S10-54]RAW95009.1 hypothetical protein CKY04_24135 [Photorhabdus sp. S8-52]